MKKKNSTPNLQVIPATIYPCNIYVFKGHSLESARKDLEHIYTEYYKYITSKQFNTPGHTILFPDGSIVILLNQNARDNYPIIAHEAFHATEFVMEYIGCKLDDSSSEPYAYLLTYIVEQIIK